MLVVLVCNVEFLWLLSANNLRISKTSQMARTAMETTTTTTSTKRKRKRREKTTASSFASSKLRSNVSQSCLSNKPNHKSLWTQQWDPEWSQTCLFEWLQTNHSKSLVSTKTLTSCSTKMNAVGPTSTINSTNRLRLPNKTVLLPNCKS